MLVGHRLIFLEKSERLRNIKCLLLQHIVSISAKPAPTLCDRSDFGDVRYSARGIGFDFPGVPL